MPTTRVVIKQDGSIEIEGLGYIGSACEEAMRKLLEKLREYGIDVNIAEHRKKPEYYAVEARSGVESEW